MSEQNPTLERLNKTYLKVLETQLKAEDSLNKKESLFKENREAINASLKTYLNNYQTDLLAIDKNLHQEIETLKKKHTSDLDALKKEKKQLVNKHSDILKEIDASYDQSRSLSTLKEEKTETEYHMGLINLEKSSLEKQNELDSKLEDTTHVFYQHIDTLEKETELKQSKRAKQFEQEILAITKENDLASEASTKEKTSIEQKLETYEIQFAKEIKESHDKYLKEITPLKEELRLLKEEYHRDLNEIDEYYDAAIAKLSKYKKEKEKIADHAAVSTFNKDIKKQTKLQKETKLQKTLRFEEADKILQTKHDEVLTHHQTTLLNIKTQGIEKISLYLNSLLLIKTKNLTDTNHSNIDILKLETQGSHKQNAIKIDDDIQRLNFNQTLDEARLLHDYETNGIKVSEALSKEETKHHYKLTMNEINKNRSYAKALHLKETETKKLTHELDLQNLDQKLKTLTKRHAFTLESIKIDHNIEKVRKDFDKEQILIEHYHYQAKNYTALKNDALKVFHPAIKTEVENRNKHRIKSLKDLLKKAEDDHHPIIEEIENTYLGEIIIYENAYQTIEQEHTQSLKTLFDTQNKERTKELEHIENLDPKKDRALIKKLKQNLIFKKSQQEETITNLKKELEQKRIIYQKMIETIKMHRLHSLEEADTLLMHIRDQFTHAINQIESDTLKDLKHYQTLQGEISHSANLFETFQRQRHEQTRTISENYLLKRIDKELQTKANLYQQLISAINQDQSQFNIFKQSIDASIEEVLTTFKKTCEEIDKTSTDMIKHIEDETAVEKRRLEQRKLKLDRNYESSLKTLTQGKNKEKSECFTRKETAEQTLKTALEHRQKEADAYFLEREGIKTKDLSHYKTRVHEIITLLESDAIKHLSDLNVPQIKTYLINDELLEI